MGDPLQNLTTAAWAIAPELAVLAAATLLVLAGAFWPATNDEERRKSGTVFVSFAAATLALALLASLINWSRPAPDVVATAPFIHDALARVIQPASFAVGLGLLLLLSQRLHGRFPAEHLACLLFISAGTSLAASANDLIALFVSLELISIPTYILLYLSRPDKRALESTVKYFLLSIFSSAFLLYGLSMLYGSAGSTNFAAIKASLSSPSGMVSVAMLEIALVLIVAGLGFRVAAVPFHFYAPDVFQGTTLPAAALLAIVPKIAGFVGLLRLTWSILLSPQAAGAPFEGLGHYGVIVVAVLAILSMTVGNVLALLQNDIRRLLAYSSVAHAGYMLVGVAVPGTLPIANNGAQAVLFYLLAYSIMTLGAFGVLVMLQRNRPTTDVADLAGLSKTNPGAALLLAVFFLGLTGLPPTIGFWSKFNLLLVAWMSGPGFMKLIALAMAVNAAIAAWYYLRVIKTAFLDEPATDQAPPESAESSPLLLAAMSLCALATIGLFFAPGAIWTLLAGM